MEENNPGITSWTQLTSQPPSTSDKGDEKFTVRLNVGPRSTGSGAEGEDEISPPVSPENDAAGGM